jgi:CheY-like chemotaxis protein
MRLLLVEDDEFTSEALGFILMDAGWDVMLAIHGQDAWNRLGSGPLPDVIVLDLMMPVMDGGQFLSALRQHPVWRTLPVVVMTAAGDPDPQLDVQAIVQKPCDPDVLLATVQRVADLSPSRLSP